MRKLLTKPLNTLDEKILRNLYCFNIKCFTIIFKNVGWGGGGGGGDVNVCYQRHYMKKYRAIRLLVFSVKTLNVVRCARYVYVGEGGGGGGGVRMGVRSVCAKFPPYSIPEIILEIG